MQDLSNKCLRAFCARISLILGFYWPLALNDEPPVTEASPDFLSSMRREWSHHSCSRLQHSSEDAIATVRLRFLRPQSSIVPTNIVVKLVENDIDCFPNPQPIQRTCSSPDCVAQTADHPPVERGRVRLPSCLVRDQLSSRVTHVNWIEVVELHPDSTQYSLGDPGLFCNLVSVSFSEQCEVEEGVR